MPLFRQSNRGRTEIDTDAARRFDGGEQITEAATEFQHAQTGRHQERKVFFQQPMIKSVRFRWTIGGARFVERLAIGHRLLFIANHI
jgi:hypothetical protein